MLTFKQYLAEMAGAKRGFKKTALSSEKMLINNTKSFDMVNANTSLEEIASMQEPNPPSGYDRFIHYPMNQDGTIQTLEYQAKSPNDSTRANNISHFVHDVISKISDVDPKTYSHKTEDASSQTKNAVRKSMGVPSFSSGRAAEDLITKVDAPEGNPNTFLIDLKMSPRYSHFNPMAERMNRTITGRMKNDSGEWVARADLVPATMTRGKKKYEQRIGALSKIKEVFDKAPKFTTYGRVLTPSVLASNKMLKGNRLKLAKIIMNHHEPIPSGTINPKTGEPDPHIKRLRVVDSDEGTHIYDVDHAWKFFEEKFKPVDYSMEFETRGDAKQSSLRLFAHSAEGGSPLHIGTIAVAHARGKGETVKYNVKHYLLPKLIEEYGYKPLASLKH